MNESLRNDIKAFIARTFVEPAEKKLIKAGTLKHLTPHPFQMIMVASGFYGKPSPDNLAKALLYPRVMGTSITTTFGSSMQKMCIRHLGAKASGIPGMDLEFIDQISKRTIIAQLKAGPNTINAGDIEPTLEEMRSARRLILGNYNDRNSLPEFAFCLTYGTQNDLSTHYTNIQKANVGDQQGVPVWVGKEFWHRMTGDEKFYEELVAMFVEVFANTDFQIQLIDAENALALDIEHQYFTNGKLDAKKL